MGNKAKAERTHARRRAAERYGIELGASTRGEIVAKIRGGKSAFVKRQSLRVAIHDVTLGDGTTVRVVWDKQRAEIVTFLERDWTG
jgi:hypothetical protein